MKFCSKCGNKIADEAVVCIHCGCQVGEIVSQTNENKNETDDLWKVATLFAFIIPPLGVILGIAGACAYKKPENVSKSVRAIRFSIGFPLLCFGLIHLFMALVEIL